MGGKEEGKETATEEEEDGQETATRVEEGEDTTRREV